MKKGLLACTAAMTIFGAAAQTYKPSLHANPDGPWSFGSSKVGGDFTPLPYPMHAPGQIDAYMLAEPNPDDKAVLGVFQSLSSDPIPTSGNWMWQPGTLLMSPGDQFVGSAIRFQAPEDGSYEVNATWTAMDPAAKKSWAWVLTNSDAEQGKVYDFTPARFKELFTQGIEGFNGTAKYEKVLQMKAGDVVEFSVGNGGDGGEGDELVTDITISKKG